MPSDVCIIRELNASQAARLQKRLEKFRGAQNYSDQDEFIIDQYINRFHNSFGHHINAFLYGGLSAKEFRSLHPDVDPKLYLQRMDELHARAALHPGPVRFLFRGTRILGAWNWRSGKIVTFDGYLSTSPFVSRALLYVYGGILLRFHVDSAEPLIYSPLEEECIVRRGSTWRFLGKSECYVDEGLFHPLYKKSEYVDIVPGWKIWVYDFVRA